MKPYNFSRKIIFQLTRICTLLIFLAPGILKGEWEQGQARFGLDYRSMQQRENVYLGNFHFDLWQNVFNTGTFSLWVDWANGKLPEKINTLGRGIISLQGYKLTRYTLNGLVGDSSLRFTSFYEKFSNSYYPDIYFRGLQGELYWVNERIRLKVFGGDLTHPEGFLGVTFIRKPERLYGIQGVFRISKNTFLGSALALTNFKGDEKLDYKQANNQIVLVDGRWKMAPWLKWLGEYKKNMSQEQEGKSSSDQQYKVGPIIESKKLRMEFNYRYSGANFYIFREAPQSDINQKGYFLQTQVTPWNGLSLFGNIDFSQNGLGGMERTRTDDIRKNAGLYFSIPKIASLSAFYNSSDSQSRADSPAPMDMETSSLYSELRFHLSFCPYLRFRDWRFDNPLLPENSFVQKIYTIGIRPVIKRKWQTYIEAEMIRKETDNGLDYKQYMARLGFYYFRSTRFSLWGELIYTQDWQKLDDSKKNHFAGFLGATGQLAWGLSYHLDIRYDRESNVPIQTLIANSNKWQFTLRLSKTWKWGKSIPIAGLRPGSRVRGFGEIEGIVFNDLNQNGIQDRGETGISGITLLLEDQSRTQTDRNGHYRFAPVAMGSHQVRLEIKKVPIQYNILSPERVKIEVKLRETTRVNFIFIESGRINGAVILDSNNNGKADPDEKGIPDVFLNLEEGDLNTYTGTDGGFSLENVNPGTYKVKIDPGTLPSDRELVSPEEYPVTVEPGKDAAMVIFLVRIKVRPVIIKKSLENKIINHKRPVNPTSRMKKPQAST